MFTPKAMEAWFTLMTEAMRGKQTSEEALNGLTKMPTTPEEWQRWMTQFAPHLTATTATPEAFESWLENWHRTMGVVPRSRYLELLEKYDALQRKLEKAEETIETLRSMLDSKEQHQQEAKKVADMWGTMMQETAKAQSEWMRTWTTSKKDKDET